MKPKSIFLGISIVLSLLIAALLPASPTLATEPDPDQSRIENCHPEQSEGRESKIDLWSSGWVDLAPGESKTLTHNVGGDIEDYALQMWFRDTDTGGYGVNNRAYGSDEDNGVWLGAFWRSLTDTTIAVARQPADVMAEQVRVWLWPMEYTSPPYCTAWAAVGQGSTVTVVHNLGGNPDDYVVKLWFRHPAFPTGVHQIYYGGAEGGGESLGAYWHGLDATQIQVSRLYADIEAEEFLLCVGLTDPPAWDSGWVSMDPGQALVLDHNLGVSILRYVVRMEFKQVSKEGAPEAPMAIHQFGYGGLASNVLNDATYLGANWQNLTNQSITLYRWADDQYADQVRVRIWLRHLSTYLPIVFKNYP